MSFFTTLRRAGRGPLRPGRGYLNASDFIDSLYDDGAAPGPVEDPEDLLSGRFGKARITVAPRPAPADYRPTVYSNSN